MDCAGMLAETGSSVAPLLTVAGLFLTVGALVLVLGRRGKRRGGMTALVLVGALSITGLAWGSSTSARAATVDDCPAPTATAPITPTPDTTSTPSTTPTPTATPTPPATGVVTANPIAAAAWSGDCLPTDASCAFTADLSALGNTTTSPGASIDWATFAVSSAPPGWTFQVTGTVLTATSQVPQAGAGTPTYTVTDTAGVVSNSATIALPTVPGPIVTADDIPESAWVLQSCTASDCTFTTDLSALGNTTTSPGASIDWATFTAADVPAAYTLSVSGTTLTTVVDPAAIDARTATYTVADTTGLVSNVANITLPLVGLP